MSSVFYRDVGNDYPVASRAAGMYLYDTAGRSYLDMSGGAAVSCLGHGHADVVAAIQKQVGQLAFAHTAFFTNVPQEDLAKTIAGNFGEPGAKVYFSSGGSEANEAALKLAWQYWRAMGQVNKTVVISRDLSYHGNTLGALSVSGSDFRRAPYERVIHDWPRIAPCYEYRHRNDSESAREYGLRVARELEDTIVRLGAENVAAFIAEPVVGATLGVVPAVDGYFGEIRRICSKYDVLFIADEVMCGSGRTGRFFAHEYDDVVPDMVTMAKSLGGGYQPVAATLVREHIADSVMSGGFIHGHTYVGHATACAAALAVQKVIAEKALLSKVRSKGTQLLDLLRDRFGDHPNIGDIRGRGLFAGLEFVADRATKEPFPVDTKVATRIKATSMQEGLICYPGSGSAGGGRGAHLMLAPPFIVEDTHLEEMAGKLEAIFKTVFEKHRH